MCKSVKKFAIVSYSFLKNIWCFLRTLWKDPPVSLFNNTVIRLRNIWIKEEANNSLFTAISNDKKLRLDDDWNKFIIHIRELLSKMSFKEIWKEINYVNKFK